MSSVLSSAVEFVLFTDSDIYLLAFSRANSVLFEESDVFVVFVVMLSMASCCCLYLMGSISSYCALYENSLSNGFSDAGKTVLVELAEIEVVFNAY